MNFPVAAPAQNIVINEIMYHPSSQDVREEFVELFNAGSTNVNLTGWRISGGIDYAFPSNAVIGAGNYLVVAAHLPSFSAKYPGVANVVGSWLTFTVTNVNGRLFTNSTPVLSNTRNAINLNNGTGTRIDEVTYADDGDWAVRRRGFDDGGFRGWMWYAEHDGLGKSLELINAAMPNEYGQNWGPSSVVGGTPGAANSIRSANIAPLIIGAQHLPVVPRSFESNSVSARILNEVASGVTTTLRWRVDGAASFSSAPMLDDGAHGDGAAGDGIFGALLSPMANGTILEYYIQASDGQGNTRTWPAPALQAPDVGNGSLGQVANALFQVDDQASSGFPPLYRLILTSAEYTELANLLNSSPNSDAEMNATFISVDGSGVDRRYLCGVRNRGHGSRSGNPHNCRVNFPSDNPWKGVGGLNMNSRDANAQVLGANLAQKAGAAGNDSHFALLRVNNGTIPGGAPGNGGLYAANEDIDSDWSDRQFPNNGGGNIYAVVRDNPPPNFDYRGEDPVSYQNTYFKQSNASENDWRDLMGMLQVMGENQTASFTVETARKVINVEQWLTHLAVMNLLGNNESGINTGNNDDYYLYRGLNDPRFILVYHDLDTIIGQGGSKSASDANMFGATVCCASGDSQGIANAMNFFMHHPQIEPLYYRTLQNLLDGPFSQVQFDALVGHVFGEYPQLADETSNMIGWMNTRRGTVQSIINGFVPPATNNPTATISGEPRSPTWRATATLTVGGTGVTHYQWRLNNGVWSAETAVATPIALSGLATGSTNTVYVVGRNSGGIYQSTTTPTVSKTWVVNTALPTVRLNEALARNDSINYFGTFPDMIELYNEGPSSVTLTGMRLTDDPSNPGKFTFPTTTLAAGAYLTVFADSAGTPGMHLGFALGQNGESVYLFNTVASGGARLDSVQFGLQLPNLSIGRLGNSGDWALTQPTFVPAGANIAQALGNPRTLKINEWLAASTPPTTEDYIELYNADPLPVALGGLYLTDEPLGAPAQHRVADLSFVAGGGFAVFTADGSEGAGPEHLNFKLGSEQGKIGLFASDLSVVDCVVYGPQRTDVSYGRCPNGGSTFGVQSFASPGSGNTCETAPPPPPTVNLMPMTSTWRWHENTNLDGVNWQASAFNDSGWLSGQALFGTATVTIGGQPTRTAMTADVARVTRYFRSSFVVPTNLNPNALQFYYILDDGMVVYVNGAERARYNMPQGTVLFATAASGAVSGTPPLTGPVPFPLGSIQPGTNSIAVEVHQFPGGSGDCFLACRLDAVLATNSPVAAGVVINEILADNATALKVGGRTPDVIEFYNPTNNAVDLAGMSLNDSPVNIPPRWIFPPGSIVPARGYYFVYADGDAPPSATNTGFGLKKHGGSLFLFKGPPLTNDILDRLDYGLQTADYSIGRVPAGSATWMLTVPTFGGTNVPATLGDPSGLRINEWMADPASGDDWFEIYNLGNLPVALADLRLTDTYGYAGSYRIPALSFIGVGSNAFQRFEADEPDTPAGPEHVNFKLSKESDNIYLLASNNATVLDSVSFGTQAMGVSEGRLPDGASAPYTFFPETPTPSDANYLPLTSVVVNEVLTHTDDPLEDAIELRNLTGAPINIGGWFLSDDKDSLGKFRIPNNTMILANGFLVFYEVAFNNDTNGVPFALSSAEGDQVYLSEASGGGVLSGYRSVAKFGPAQNGVSFGRYVNSVDRVDYPALSARTFGQDTPANVEQFRTGGGLPNAYPKVGPIVISEIMYHPPDIIVPGVSTNDNVVEEFIELRNTSAAPVPLYDPAHTTNGWRLRDAVGFTFTSSQFVPAGGHLIVVSFDPATDSAARAQFQAAYGTNSVLVGPYSGKLDNSSDSVELVKPDPPQTNGSVPYVLVEKVVYSDALPWPTNADGLGMSLQRLSDSGYANDPTNWFAAAPALGGGGAMDTDHDGMPDDWEMANGLNKMVDDAGGDADLDGMTNLQEYLAGTNPQSAASTLRLVATLSPPNANLRFNAVAGRTYSIVYSTLLPAVAWTKFADVPAQGSSGPVVVQDPSGGPQRFYRVVTPAIP
ncbi:MAG TPA: lamin tail domain-containing protein [Verrucomicrobiae bacterium]|nr:lamin tail domain-containing protein [Verrucomicrobiae bacterium]